MENNTLQNEIIVQDENNGVLTSMHKELDSIIFFNENWCIYKVPEFILKGHEYFYEPLVMSIGPVFYKNDPKLEPMQKIKWLFLKGFLRYPKNGCTSVNPYINFVREKEVEIRGNYQQQIRLSSDEFVEMIVLDAAFLIYIIMLGSQDYFKVPLLWKQLPPQFNYSCYDVSRLENQIPYFVLKGIFDIAFGHIYLPTTLIHATLTFIGGSHFGILGCKAIKSIIEGNKITDESDIAHLLDLQWMCCRLSLSTPLRNQPITNPTIVSNTAKQLYDAGVTFVAGESENPLDVTFANGKLTISKLNIYDNIESQLRNLVCFEQCHYYEDTYFIDYIVFLDQLIDTVEDVQVLVKNNIIRNQLGSDDDVVKLFNNIGKNVIASCKNYYYDVSEDLNRYASTRRHKWMAILRSKYFNHPWTILSVIAAFMLFVLTLLQTIAAYIYK
ncbi:UPF0481 protein At3g47200-like [Chenopodium quinoa]|uniref:Uncharacterized protein n=1 Tax=Chenopodium quinoa TaxID=63459 RepID=A0A803MJS7_CHEQI|nr:UPF0481 protein At3g47200-like [Chenopodium quinoa]